MDDQIRYYIDPKDPPQKSHLKKLKTHNIPTFYAYNTKSKHKVDLRLATMLWVVLGVRERVTQRIQRHRRASLYWSICPQRVQAETEKSSYGLDWLQKGVWYDPVSWIINCLKTYRISYDVINFIETNMKTWRVELTAGGKSSAETKIQSGILHGDAQSPLLFVIAIMPLNYILTKCSGD